LPLNIFDREVFLIQACIYRHTIKVEIQASGREFL
jgi:hypothetical protein